MLAAVRERAVDAELEFAPRGLERALGDEFDEAFAPVAELDELRDGDHAEPEALLQFDELRQARHGAVLVEDLADHAARVQAGERGQVDRGFGVASALEHAAGAGHEREDVARLDELFRLGVGVREDRDGLRAVVGADARRDAFGGVDRDGEGGALRFAVLRDHLGDPQAAELVFDRRDTDEPARVADHHVDRFGGDLGRRHHEVAFVLAVLVVGHNDELPRGDVREGCLDAVKGLVHETVEGRR